MFSKPILITENNICKVSDNKTKPEQRKLKMICLVLLIND